VVTDCFLPNILYLDYPLEAGTPYGLNPGHPNFTDQQEGGVKIILSISIILIWFSGFCVGYGIAKKKYDLSLETKKQIETIINLGK